MLIGRGWAQVVVSVVTGGGYRGELVVRYLNGSRVVALSPFREDSQTGLGVVAATNSRMTWWDVRGLPRQFFAMNQNMRCSTLSTATCPPDNGTP
jgi:hypothetical protein